MSSPPVSIPDDRVIAAILTLGLEREAGDGTPEKTVERYFAVLSHLRAAHDLHRTGTHAAPQAGGASVTATSSSSASASVSRRLAEGESPD